MHFMTKSKLAVDIHTSHKVNPVNNTCSTNFLGLTLDSTLPWKTHIDQLSSKLNSTCYVIRSLKSVISTKNLRTIYFSYVHSIIVYGIIFWGNSPYSNNIFKIQKRAIRIIMNAGNRVSCRELFKKLNILPLHSWYLLTPWSRVLLEKLTGSAASQEIPGIFGTRRFITVLTSARCLSLS